VKTLHLRDHNHVSPIPDRDSVIHLNRPQRIHREGALHNHGLLFKVHRHLLHSKYTLGPESNLLQLRETILTAANDVESYHLVIDDLSTLLDYTPSETAFKFFQGISSDIRRNSSSGILIMVPEILETRLTNLLYSLADVVIEMSLAEMGGALRRFVRIRFLRGVPHSTEWSEYLIGPRGIEIISE